MQGSWKQHAPWQQKRVVAEDAPPQKPPVGGLPPDEYVVVRELLPDGGVLVHRIQPEADFLGPTCNCEGLNPVLLGREAEIDLKGAGDTKKAEVVGGEEVFVACH